MKRRTLILALGIFFLIRTPGWGEEWQAYQATKKGDIYYFDKASIETSREGQVKVWVRVEKTDFDGSDLKKHVDEIQSGNKTKVTGEVLQLLEIDCRMRTFRIVNLAVYNKARDIQEYYSDPSEWETIHPESVTHDLFGLVCQ